MFNGEDHSLLPTEIKSRVVIPPYNGAHEQSLATYLEGVETIIDTYPNGPKIRLHIDAQLGRPSLVNNSVTMPSWMQDPSLLDSDDELPAEASLDSASTMTSGIVASATDSRFNVYKDLPKAARILDKQLYAHLKTAIKCQTTAAAANHISFPRYTLAMIALWKIADISKSSRISARLRLGSLGGRG